MTTIDTLIDADAIQARVAEMAAEINRDYAGQEVVIVPVLKGSFVFAADLIRHLDIDCKIDFLGLRSYEGTESTGVVQITSDLTKSIEGEHVIVVEDIVDTGLTMQYMMENLRTRKPASVKLASLLHKPSRTTVEVDIDYLGFSIEDVFVIGYGLDFDQLYRNLPYLGVVRQEG
ncbi:MAG: hypoxanthine phosphoribosyltransferase [Sandaracinus sp.]|nr:hypoxanthine phosphoribosyltransferase [Sandaracinus sp.]|tara:strand:- start:3127 stop:3648 length:522 start_codon:yes stop_codon:yes gene_type:complete